MIKLGYVKENRDYQRHLDKRFNGKIVAVDRYVNPKATIKHGCLECGQTFWARPGYLIHLNTTDHFCIKQNENNRTTTKRGKRKPSIPDNTQETMNLYNRGISMSEIASLLGISRDKVRYRVEKARGVS